VGVQGAAIGFLVIDGVEIMWRFLGRFLKNEDAATSIEYALIGGLISIAIVGGATAIGTTIGEDYNNLGDQFQNF